MYNKKKKKVNLKGFFNNKTQDSNTKRKEVYNARDINLY